MISTCGAAIICRPRWQQAMNSRLRRLPLLACAKWVSPSAESNKVFTADSLGVAHAMRPAFEQLTGSLEARGVAKKRTKRAMLRPRRLSLRAAADSAPEQAAAPIFTKHPGHLPEGLLSAATGAELGPILRGEKDAVSVLFSSANADLLDQFYGDGLLTSHTGGWLAIGSAVQEAARHLPEGRGLRILEVGAGTGWTPGLSVSVLPLLERGTLHSYTLSDVSASFFAGAMQKLAAFPEVEFKDIQILEEARARSRASKRARSTSVIGTNGAACAVGDVRAALEGIFTICSTPGRER